jgi:hypothetical protein
MTRFTPRQREVLQDWLETYSCNSTAPSSVTRLDALGAADIAGKLWHRRFEIWCEALNTGEPFASEAAQDARSSRHAHMMASLYVKLFNHATLGGCAVREAPPDATCESNWRF